MGKLPIRSAALLFASAILIASAVSGCSSGTEVPDVVGQQVEFARGVLIGAGFSVEAREEAIDGVTEGQVISQEPAAGEMAPQEEPIELVVAIRPTFSIQGTFTLVDSDIGGTSSNCYGTGGYDDIESGVAVTVRDGSGTVLATGRLGTGSSTGSNVTCEFGFEVLDIPQSSFYSVEVGRRGELTYSHDEMVAQYWSVAFTLG